MSLCTSAMKFGEAPVDYCVELPMNLTLNLVTFGKVRSLNMVYWYSSTEASISTTTAKGKKKTNSALSQRTI